MLFHRLGENLWVLRSHGFRQLLDLQYRSLVQSLRSSIQTWPARGHFLDFGAGENPYAMLWPPGWTRKSLDLHRPADYQNLADLPVDLRFDRILLLEVLEHLSDPEEKLQGLQKHLTPEGRILISVPFSARIHPCPEDYQRWTPQGLELLAARCRLEIIRLEFRGNDLATLVQKLNYYFFRRLWNPGALVLGIVALPFVAVAHLGLLCAGSLRSETPHEDPLGFFLELKSRSASSL